MSKTALQLLLTNQYLKNLVEDLKKAAIDKNKKIEELYRKDQQPDS